MKLLTCFKFFGSFSLFNYLFLILRQILLLCFIQSIEINKLNQKSQMRLNLTAEQPGGIFSTPFGIEEKKMWKISKSLGKHPKSTSIESPSKPITLNFTGIIKTKKQIQSLNNIKCVSPINHQLLSQRKKPVKYRLHSQNRYQKSNIKNKDFQKNTTQKTLKQESFEKNFAKKVIEDLKKENFQKRKTGSKRYEQSLQNEPKVKISHSVNSQKRISQKEKTAKISMEKIKNSFCVSEIKFGKNSGSAQLHERKKLFSRCNFHSQSGKFQKIQLSSPMTKQQCHIEGKQIFYLSNTLKKCAALPQYSSFIHSSVQYKIDLSYLQVFGSFTKEKLLENIDINSMKLVQSVYLCSIDILNLPQKNTKLDVIRQYAIIYLQSFDKLKIEFILSEVLYKGTRNQLIEYFLLQRIMFFYILGFCSSKQEKVTQMKEKGTEMKEKGTEMKEKRSFQYSKLIEMLSASEQVYQMLINILTEEICHIQGKPKIEKQKIQTNDEDRLMGSFKLLKINKILNRKLVVLNQLLNTMKPKKEDKSQYVQIFKTFYAAFLLNKKNQLDILDLFKCEMYFAWSKNAVPPLFYLPKVAEKPFTLVIDLDQTLVFYNEESRILKYRPYMDKFLQTVAQYFELIIYSVNPKERTDIIVDEIQRGQKMFTYRLYKNHLTFQEGVLRKNVSYLGRSLERTILIDDEQNNTTWLPLNSFKIKPFVGDKQDKELLGLLDWLIALMEEKPLDIRGRLKKPQSFLEQIVEMDQSSSTLHKSIEP